MADLTVHPERFLAAYRDVFSLGGKRALVFGFLGSPCVSYIQLIMLPKSCMKHACETASTRSRICSVRSTLQELLRHFGDM